MRAGQSARIILPLREGVNRISGGCKSGPRSGNKLRLSGVLLFEQFCGPIGVVLITMVMSKNPKAKNRSEMKPAYPFLNLPKAQGLYCPKNEHDACGVGFIANIEGQKSHDIVLKGIQILINLTHRGACGCDPETGDGAGILIQIPHAFFDRECSQLGFTLPAPGEYGVGMVFLPVDPQERILCEGMLEKCAREQGLTVLGWRDTPINGDMIGRVARNSQPYIEQIFIRRGPGNGSGCAGTQALRDAEAGGVPRRRIRAEGEGIFLHSVSFLAHHCLQRTLAGSADHAFLQGAGGPGRDQRAGLVHQRFSTNTFPSWQLAHPYRYVCHNGEINTLRGNANWMYARQSVLASPLFGKDMEKLLPIITPGGSDSAMLDNAVELLTLAGRSLPHVMSMLIPEAWDNDTAMPEDVKAFYEYHASLMEPWDGPGRGCVYRRASDRREAGPQRIASRALFGDGGRLGGDGVRSWRAADDQARRHAHERPACARPHVAGGYGTEATDLGRRSEKAARGAQALRAVGEGQPDYARSSAEPDERRCPRTTKRS